MHPDTRSLIAYLDGELEAPERRNIALHLQDCPRCRAEADTIESDRDWFLVFEAASLALEAPPLNEGLSRVVSAVREYRESHPGIAVPETLETALVAELQAYFGSRVADIAGDGGQADSPERLLTVFLGRRAASTLVRDLQQKLELRRFVPPRVTA
jgi:anti-sigma factor RsiW